MTAGTVFPIGHYGGCYTDRHLVRVGPDLEPLTGEEFGIWVLAHGLADVGRGDWTRDDILDRAGDAELADPVARFDALLDRGLLAAVPTEPERVDESVAFATAYRLEPLLVGLGAADRADQPDRYAIGIPGVGTSALLDVGSYQLWQWGGTAANLWRLCQDRIAASGGRGLDSLVDPARVLVELLGELRVLVVHGCGYLDVVPANPNPNRNPANPISDAAEVPE